MTVDWESYQQCPVCGAPLGEPCASMTVGFITEAVRITARDEPHTSRKLRAAAERDAKFGRVINPAGDGR